MSVARLLPFVSGRRQQLVDATAAVTARLRQLGHLLAEPLRVDPDTDMRLSIPESQTTTIDGDIGWSDRPPATVACPECDAEIYQYRPDGTLECPECYVERPHGEFPELELLYLNCPVCRNRMEHGRRHPQQFSVPEWATCHTCRYHWEFEHF
jgi:hypothetical protein